MTTNFTTIKLETPVPFCSYWFSCHPPIHVGQHSQHNDLAMGWKISTRSTSSTK